MMHPETAVSLGCEKKKSMVLAFGSCKTFAELVISESVPDNELSISRQIMDWLHLPVTPRYELLFKGDELVIGPCIGVLLSSKHSRINAKRLEKAHYYVKEYGSLHGALIVFDLYGVNREKRIISGYCYNPYTDEFERGLFPYPNALYRKAGLNNEWKNHFLSVIGNKLFNNPYYSKWKMYQSLSGDETLKSYLPYTEIMTNTAQVFELLDAYNRIYIKPLLGLRGHGIIRLTKESEVYLIELRQQNENNLIRCSGAEEATENLKNLLGAQPCMLQQGIELIRINNRLIDFRCVMQKNGLGLWECKAIVARMGKKNSVVSNVSSGGRAYTVPDLLEKIKGQYEWETLNLPDQLQALALQVCGRLDQAGAVYGMVGLDIAADTDGRLWIIEVNNRDPDPSIALNIHDRKLYEELKVNLMRYAKWLSGF